MFHFYVAFTRDASLFVFWKSLLATRNYIVCGPGRFLLAAQAFQFVEPGTESIQAYRCPPKSLDSKVSKQSIVILTGSEEL